MAELAFNVGLQIGRGLPGEIEHEIDAGFDGPEALLLHGNFALDGFGPLVHDRVNALQQRLVLRVAQFL